MRGQGRQQQLVAPEQAEAKNQVSSERTLVSGVLTGWDASAAFPLAEIRASLGQAGDLATETKVGGPAQALIAVGTSLFAKLPQWQKTMVCLGS